MIESGLLIASALFFGRVVVLEASYRRPRRKDGRVYYPPGVATRLTLGLMIPLCFYVAYQISLEAPGNFIGVASISALGVASAIGMPPDIATDKSGIFEHRWFGLLRKHIAWQGAVATYSSQIKEVIVIGADGTTITHGPNNIGQGDFLGELRVKGVDVRA